MIINISHRDTNKNSKGFTLVEILVVAAIIALLLSIVVVSLVNTRKSAQDARRKTDISNIGAALEQCYADPSCGAGSNAYISQSAMPTAIGAHMAKVPKDPVGGDPYGWANNSGVNDNYCVCATLSTADGAGGDVDLFCASPGETAEDVDPTANTLADCAGL